MSRTVAIRASYIADAGFLSRLQQAVEKDPKVPPEIKQELCASLNSLIIRFHQVDALVKAPIPLPIPEKGKNGKRVKP